MTDELPLDLNFELPECYTGPFFPATLRTHTKAEVRSMLSSPPLHQRTATHGKLHVQMTTVHGLFQVLIVNRTSGDGISIEMPSLTDAINVPGTDAFA